MQAALPHLDLLAPGADLESIERVLPRLSRRCDDATTSCWNWRGS